MIKVGTRWRIGLTGGIGSGKSTVAGMLQRAGAEIIDADALARATTQAGGTAITAIEASFGPSFIVGDGSLDRDRMRAHVFTHPDARQELEQIVHPLVAQGIRERVERSIASCLVFDVPLLIESPRWRVQLDHVLVVDCTEETQIRRVQRRNGWERHQVEAVIHSQSRRWRRLAAADTVIVNESEGLLPLQHLVAQHLPDFGLS